MSDIRFNNWKHQSGTGGVTQNAAGNIGIGSTLPTSALDIGGDIVITGVTTSSNFKTGSSNLHNVGIEIAGINVLGADTPIGTGSTIYDDGGARFSGVVTATSFSGSGSGLTNIPSAQLTGALPAISGANLTGVSGVTINSNADNRLITGSGTANTLNGESELTFDGNSLVLENTTGNIAAIRNGGGATLTLHGCPDAGNTAATNNHDMGNIAFKTADGTDRNNVCAYVTGRAVGTFTNSSHPTQLEFWTTTDGSTTTTKRLIITKSGQLIPAADNTYNLGDSSNRWANIYTGDLNLSNLSSGGNKVDGTEGDWTIQEGESDLFLINNRNGKKYQFMLKEIS